MLANSCYENLNLMAYVLKDLVGAGASQATDNGVWKFSLGNKLGRLWFGCFMGFKSNCYSSYLDIKDLIPITM